MSPTAQRACCRRLRCSPIAASFCCQPAIISSRSRLIRLPYSPTIVLPLPYTHLFSYTSCILTDATDCRRVLSTLQSSHSHSPQVVARSLPLLFLSSSPLLSSLLLGMSQRWRSWLQPSLKHIKSIVIRYDPLDPSTRGTRYTHSHSLTLTSAYQPTSTHLRCLVCCQPSSEFLFQASNRQLARSNPKCSVTHLLYHDYSPAHITFTFNNNKAKQLLTADRSVDEITMEMALMVRDMENREMLGEEEEINEEDEEESKSR